ncbi:hypothetical protein GCM10011579_095700 [Streptomyces albiflavescens]|uniref:Uncharacterized protein n=1 Tax=Streptomyces albiflavescens TaxID=1623582 RepID=A0A918DB74_9ACTN|nr:hypothetical protein [Streptomyces albiflavescens]GGN95294.1 hypothetical protein GCM10011579_095700 [Streptomyces albiflavescens]
MLAAANRADPFGRLGSPQEIAETITSLGVVKLSAGGGSGHLERVSGAGQAMEGVAVVLVIWFPVVKRCCISVR